MTKAIPSYALYGESGGERYPDVLHCESIFERSRLHDWRFVPHRHVGLQQFFFIRKGSGVAVIEGAARPFGAGTAVTIPAMSVHGFEFERQTDGYVVTIPVSVLERAVGEDAALLARLERSAVLSIADEAELAEGDRIFAGIAREHAGTAANRAQALFCLAGLAAIWVGRALLALSAEGEERRDPGLALVRRFLKAIEQGYREHRPLAAYAAALGVTPTYLSRCCRAATGRSASLLVQERLMLEAKRSLIYTAMTVSEIAYALGFYDPAHFTKFFTKRTGLAPSAFRDAVLEAPASGARPLRRRAVSAL